MVSFEEFFSIGFDMSHIFYQGYFQMFVKVVLIW